MPHSLIPTVNWWKRTWYAPCDNVGPGSPEFVTYHRAGGHVDRLRSDPVQPPRAGLALRAEHVDGELGVRDDGHVIGGWRSEVVGPFETAREDAVRYEWSTLLPESYPVDARVNDGGKDHGKRAWQVLCQWHQGDNDRGGPPPIAFTVVGDQIMLNLHRHHPDLLVESIQRGEWPLAPLDRGTWHRFSVEIVWNVGQGSIRVWHNDVPVVFQPQSPPSSPGEPVFPVQATEVLTGLETLFPPQGQKPPEAYQKAGIYRRDVPTQPPGPFVIYHDEFARFERRRIMLWPEPLIIKPPKLVWPIKLKLPPWPWPNPPWPPFRRRG